MEKRYFVKLLKNLVFGICIILFNVLLYFFNDKLEIVELILKLNLLFLWLLSWKLILDIVWYYNLKKKETYNELHNIVLSQVEYVKKVLDEINIDLNKKRVSLNVVKEDKDYYVDFVREIYRLNEVIFTLKLVNINLDSLVIVDSKTKEWYKKYVYSIVRMKLAEKGIIKGGKWNPEVKRILMSTSDEKIINKIAW